MRVRMGMNCFTIEHWDEAVWERIEHIFYQSFPEHGRKTKAIIKRMLEQRLGELHEGVVGSETAAMALTGKIPDANVNVLLIDYLAVREDLRIRGYGRRLVEYIKEWAADVRRADGIIIEIESDPTETNRKRYRFWESCGFHATDYIHHYRVVPEPYQAMYLPLHPGADLPEDGETLFQYITAFHRKTYRGH